MGGAFIGAYQQTRKRSTKYAGAALVAPVTPVAHPKCFAVSYPPVFILVPGFHLPSEKIRKRRARARGVR
jgi:hypothetical protein